MQLERLECRAVLATFLVDTSADAGPGSLRAALLAANSTPGADEIQFQIGAVGSTQTIDLLTPLPVVTESVALDGWTQGGPNYQGAPLIELRGTAVANSGFLLGIVATDCLVRGLSITGTPYPATGLLLSGGGSHVVQGNYFGLRPDGSPLGNGLHGIVFANSSHNLLGGDGPLANVISANGATGLILAGANATQNTVVGNRIGTDPAGLQPLGNANWGIAIEFASNNQIGGNSPGAGNVVSGNALDGILISGSSTQNNQVEGNVVGLSATSETSLPNGWNGIRLSNGAAFNQIGGTAVGAGNRSAGNVGSGIALDLNAPNNVLLGNRLGLGVVAGSEVPRANGDAGIALWNAPNTVIGGATPGAGNVLSGNSTQGIRVLGDANGTRIEGNLIGLLPDGVTPAGNGSHGVFLDAAGVSLGGVTASHANRIAYSGGSGVVVASSAATGNALRRNSIFANAGLGIDLGGDWAVAANDANDADTGPNGRQNFPELALATAGATTRVVGSLQSQPNSPFEIEFFANAQADPSGNGEGQRWLGSITVTTDGAGHAAFDALLSAPTSMGEFLSAIAIAANGDTSEFSTALVATYVNSPPVLAPLSDIAANERSLISFTASATDANVPAESLVFSLTQAPAGATIDVQTGEFRWTPTESQGPGVFVVEVQVTDNGMPPRDARQTLTVTVAEVNDPPHIAIVGPTRTVRGQVQYFEFQVADPDAPDANGPFVYQINWGDGTPLETYSGGATLIVPKTYRQTSDESSGGFVVSAIAINNGGLSSSAAQLNVESAIWDVQSDPTRPGQHLLAIGGSSDDDVIRLRTWRHQEDFLRLRIKDREFDIVYATTLGINFERILVYAQAGHDTITIEDDVSLPAEVWGGAGDDRIRGGSGADQLFGDAGNDSLSGGSGRDLLVGGTGEDRLHGDGSEDLLIGGELLYANDRFALAAIMAEWTSGRSDAERRSNLSGATSSGLNGGYLLRANASSAAANTVVDDGQRDLLWGDQGIDWFFANLDGDSDAERDELRDRSNAESAEDLDWWL